MEAGDVDRCRTVCTGEHLTIMNTFECYLP